MGRWLPAGAWRGVGVLVLLGGSGLLVASSPPLTAPVLAGFEGLPQLAPEQRAGTLVMDATTRLPAYEPPTSLPPVFRLPITAEDLSRSMRRYIPYLNGSRDVAEPESLYLWDLAARQTGIREEAERRAIRPEIVVARQR